MVRSKKELNKKTKSQLINEILKLEKTIAKPPDVDKQIEDLMQINDTQADEIEKLNGEKLELEKKIEELQGQLEKAAATETRLRKKKGAKFSAYGQHNLTEEEYNQLLKDKSD